MTFSIVNNKVDITYKGTTYVVSEKLGKNKEDIISHLEEKIETEQFFKRNFPHFWLQENEKMMQISMDMIKE